MHKMLMGKHPGTLTGGLEEELLMNLCKHRDKHSCVIKSTLFTCTIYQSACVEAPFKADTEVAKTNTGSFFPALLRAAWSHHSAFKPNKSQPIKLSQVLQNNNNKKNPLAAVTR